MLAETKFEDILDWARQSLSFSRTQAIVKNSSLTIPMMDVRTLEQVKIEAVKQSETVLKMKIVTADIENASDLV